MEQRRGIFAKCENIVALAGAEPFIEAYRQGADIILCGRSSDTAIMAALPIYWGMPEGASWHGAKTVECGAQCSDTSGNNCILLEVDSAGFTVTPTMPDTHCTPYTVSAHLLYENADPFCLTESSGAFLTQNAVYTQKDERSVRVTGSDFEKAEVYTMKLEGSKMAGYQNISLVGIADREIMLEPKKWVDNVSAYVQNLLDRNGFLRESYSFNFKMYGYNAVVDSLNADDDYVPREIGVLLTVTADTQELATQIAKEFNPYLLHFPVELTNDKTLLPTFAFPFSPVDCSKGPIYEFCLHHVVEMEDSLELVNIVYQEI
ncbi:acyclic terpene utilization AtuA family protein [Roseburia hominis]